MIDPYVGMKFIVTYDMQRTHKCRCEIRCRSHAVVITDVLDATLRYRAIDNSFLSSTQIDSFKEGRAPWAVYSEYKGQIETFYGILQKLIAAA